MVLVVPVVLAVLVVLVVLVVPGSLFVHSHPLDPEVQGDQLVLVLLEDHHLLPLLSLPALLSLPEDHRLRLSRLFHLFL